MTSVGYATLQIIPSAKGFAGAISSQTSAGMATAGTSAGATAGKAAGKSFVGGMGPLLAVGGALAVGGFLKGSVDEASNLEESLNAVRVSYGDAADGILAIGKNSAKSFGMSNVDLNSMSVRFSAFAKTIAGDGGDVTKAFEGIMGRATDFASVMNLEVADAAALFQSGLAGETEPLRKYGIDLSAAAVESYAYANGIAASGEALTEQQKVQARAGALMAQTSKVQGDFANTSGGLANQQRILGAQFQNLKADIGTALLPVITKLVTVAGQVVTVLKENSAVLLPIAGIVAGIVVGLLALKGVMMVITGVMRAYAIVQAAVNLVMMLNPVGLLIIAIVGLIAAVVILWKKSETFRDIVTGVWEAVKTVVMTVVNAIIAYYTFLWNAIKTAVGYIVGYYRTLWNVFTTVAGAIIGAVQKIIGKFGEFISFVAGLPGKVLSAVSGFASLLFESGKNLLEGLMNGIKAVAGKLKDAVLAPVKGAVNAVKGFLGIKSPSRLFASIGLQTMAGLEKGIAGNAAGPQSAMLSAVTPPTVPDAAMGNLAGGGALAGMKGSGLTIIVNNPTPEPASRSLSASLQKVAALGLEA